MRLRRTGLRTACSAYNGIWLGPKPRTANEPVQVSGDIYTATVPQHGVVLLRISIASGRSGF